MGTGLGETRKISTNLKRITATGYAKPLCLKIMNLIETSRIKKFKQTIIKEIPKFPNNKETKEFLEAKSLSSLFIDYTNWACRYVANRKRKVQIEPAALSDHRWSKHKPQIESFLEKVRNGQDLTPHLSLQVHSRGYTPASSEKVANVDKWADKDFLLNVMGYHHFHLGTKLEASGHVERTDDVIFAHITREKFNMVAFFDHSVFEKHQSGSTRLTSERERLWKIFDKRNRLGLPQGSIIAPSMITTSGHALNHVNIAIDYASVVREIDPQLDQKEFIKSLYENKNLEIPPKPKVKWHLNYLDLGLLDEKNGFFFVLRYGPT